MNHPFKLKNAALLMALAAVYPMSVYSAAGVAQYTVGDVNVRRGAATTALTKGQPIDSGDSIVTGGRGVAQIRFSDGGIVSLSPNSQFNIDRYVDDNDPGKDSFAVSFLRGGMRAISGLIGKRKPENYKVTTNTATIGIRGSGMSGKINEDGSSDWAGEQDEIVVCTNAGCITLIVGEIARVKDGNSLPSRIIKRSNVPPLVARQDLFTPASPIVIQPVLPAQTGISGVLSGVSAMFAFGDGYADYYPRGGEDPSTGIGTFDAGQMIKHEVPESELVPAVVAGGSIVEKTSTGAGSFGTVGGADDPGFIGWGYWDQGKETYTQPQITGEDGGPYEYSGVHYLVGRPTPLAQMPMEGTAVYRLLGGTAPTAYDSYSGNSTLLVGRLIDAGLTVQFGLGALQGYVRTEFDKNGEVVPVNIFAAGYVNGSTFYAYESNYKGYSGDSYGRFGGFFTADQAGRAGIVYETSNASVGEVRGSAVLLRDGSTTQVTGLSALFTGHLNDEESSFPITIEQPLGTYPFASYTFRDPSWGTATFVNGNQMVMHDDGGEDGDGYYGGGSSITALFTAQGPVSSFGAMGNPTDSDFVGWGYWANGALLSVYGAFTAPGLHYVVGRPTPEAQMPVSGTATFTSVGGSAPTATYNGTSIVGTLLGATLGVDFGAMTVNASVGTRFVKNGSTVDVNLSESGSIINNSFTAGQINNCGGNVSGFFIGNQATRAAIVYQQDSSISRSGTPANIGVVQGAAGLQRGAITPAPLPDSTKVRAP